MHELDSHSSAHDDIATPATPTRKRPKPGERREQILHTLAYMLETPKSDKITTASLAARLDVSEAALYRHFASKAQMFEGLIEFIEQSIFGLVNQIIAREEQGYRQVQAIMQMLMTFAEKNPGMTRVLTGEALVNEDARLQERINQLVDRLEISLKQSLRIALTQHQTGEGLDPSLRAALLINVILGRWQRFARSGFGKLPSEGLDAQLRVLLS
ncbi:MAG: nucleoid occlusion factor SlmA [Ottowia sp.]|nr:nucleoid occlusion factor SlmA [Ottowia sp.]